MTKSFDPEYMICRCFELTAKKIADITRANKLIDAGQLPEFCPLGSGCGTCWSQAQQVVDSVNNDIFSSSEPEKQISYIQSVLNRSAKRKLAKQGIEITADSICGTEVSIRVTILQSSDFFPALNVGEYAQSILQEKIHNSLTVKELE